MDSDLLKVEALCWLRYGKRMPVVCTEVGRWSADVLGLCDTMSIEVEVKVSKADLLREFSAKSSKHYYYANAKDEQQHIPNYFYFMVPEALGEEARAILADKAPKAGLAVLVSDTRGLPGSNISILRKATKLRHGRPSPQMLRVALARMSSELCGTKHLVRRLKHQILDSVNTAMTEVVEAAAGTVGTLDCEEAELDLDLRAAQLAACVEGLDWASVQDKDKWRKAAKNWLEAQQHRNKEWTHAALRDRDPDRRE